MVKKSHISNPIQFETSHSETRAIEGALAMAQDIKDKKIDTIQHGKAAKALEFIEKAVGSVVDWLKANADVANSNEVQYVDEQVTQMLLDKIGPETELGDWLNQDKKAGPQYRGLIKALYEIDVPEPLPKSFFGKVQRTITEEVGKRFSLDFKKKSEDVRSSVQSKNSDLTEDTDLDISSDEESPKTPTNK